MGHYASWVGRVHLPFFPFALTYLASIRRFKKICPRALVALLWPVQRKCAISRGIFPLLPEFFFLPC